MNNQVEKNFLEANAAEELVKENNVIKFAHANLPPNLKEGLLKMINARVKKKV